METNVRGKIDEFYYYKHKSESYDFLLAELTNSSLMPSKKTAVVRIIGTKFFKKNEKTLAPILLTLIMRGCPLYTKIEIQSVLSTGNEATARLLVENLGAIGHNQHSVVPSKTSNKPTYPIARDICARTLQKMDKVSVRCICSNSTEGKLTDSKKSEALDVLGYCIFHNNRLINDEVLQLIINETKSDNAVCRWKAIRALSAFRGNGTVKNYLQSIYDENNVPVINAEIVRSLSFVG